MRLQISCQLDYEAYSTTPLILMLRPRSGAGQWIIKEEYILEPSVPITEYTDMYGNLCQRLLTPVGKFNVLTSSIVQTADEIDVAPGADFVLIEDLPPEELIYLLPSRYCESDQLGNLAFQIVGNAYPGYDQVEAIRKWIHQNIFYQYGFSNASTSAKDTAAAKVGVCRDFSHLGIALCRSLSIPARMVVGYLHELDPMDLHAWFEAFVGGRWYTFDATQDSPKGNRVVLAYGRDAADVALATQFGSIYLSDMRVSVSIAEEVSSIL
ncbi:MULTISPECIES: transglutaminase family protein [unclassified Arcicella]|uniref:transglutaminase family protein n=1 Tax=unclassified Arcicella TaxID=2644986 RepID=UPI00285D0F2D|nr:MULTISPECIES: transglutaminase family protein [unclassified Arcicella]MDR6563233.1 transglutaminase-like putative cysteine protease [Arcicella sp. BE51]MDR6811616.1 transglutaminase-like putative cysteine protease [Arcicella sp. BE140]MDR6823142.1 transglutaminase-like putative cysteine protease [Arcicella sp. BE139]